MKGTDMINGKQFESENQPPAWSMLKQQIKTNKSAINLIIS